MDRDEAPAGRPASSRNIKQRWDRLSDAEIARGQGDREYLVGKIHERYGLARDEIDQALGELDARGEHRPVGPLGSQGYADADSVVPPGDVALGEDIKAHSEMHADSHEVRRDPGKGAADKDEDGQTGSIECPPGQDEQDVLKDSGAATRAAHAAPLDRPRRREDRRRQGDSHRS